MIMTLCDKLQLDSPTRQAICKTQEEEHEEHVELC